MTSSVHSSYPKRKSCRNLSRKRKLEEAEDSDQSSAFKRINTNNNYREFHRNSENNIVSKLKVASDQHQNFNRSINSNATGQSNSPVETDSLSIVNDSSLMKLVKHESTNLTTNSSKNISELRKRIKMELEENNQTIFTITKVFLPVKQEDIPLPAIVKLESPETDAESEPKIMEETKITSESELCPQNDIKVEHGTGEPIDGSHYRIDEVKLEESPVEKLSQQNTQDSCMHTSEEGNSTNDNMFGRKISNPESTSETKCDSDNSSEEENKIPTRNGDHAAHCNIAGGGKGIQIKTKLGMRNKNIGQRKTGDKPSPKKKSVIKDMSNIMMNESNSKAPVRWCTKPLKSSTKVKKEPKAKCSECNLSFSSKSALQDHVTALHSSSKPYKCNLCDYASAREICLKQHHQNIHNKEPHRCEECEYTTFWKSRLTLHKAIHRQIENLYAEVESISPNDAKHCSKCDFVAHKHSTLHMHEATHDNIVQL